MNVPHLQRRFSSEFSEMELDVLALRQEVTRERILRGEQEWHTMMLSNSLQILKLELECVESTESQRQELELENRDLLRKYEMSKENLLFLEGEVDRLSKLIEHSESLVNDLESRIKSILTSRSWRIGRSFTAPVRTFRKLRTGG